MQQRPRPTGRRMTRQQYEAQQRQNRIAIAIIAAIAVLIIVAVILILKPHGGGDDAVATMVEAGAGQPAAQTEAPQTQAPQSDQPQAGGVDLAAMTGTEPENTVQATAAPAEEAPAAAETPVPELPPAVDEVFSTRNPDGGLRSVRMRVIGDIMFCQSQLVYARDSGYDFHNQFSMIADQLANADYTMGNMEGTIGKYKSSNYSGYPQFNAPDVALQPLKDAGAEVVIAFPHWGKEYVRTPDDSQKKYAKQLAEAGVDIIIGSHSHMVQPMGYQTVATANGGSRQVFTMFSMGNFISDHTVQYTDNGVILDFTVNEHQDGTFTCDSVGYIPTYTWKQNGAVTVLPSGKYLNERPSGMDDENYKRMVASYYEIIEVIGDKFQLING